MPQGSLDRLRVFSGECHPSTTSVSEAVEIKSFALIIHVHQERTGFPVDLTPSHCTSGYERITRICVTSRFQFHRPDLYAYRKTQDL